MRRVGFDLVQPVALYHLGDCHLGGRPRQAFRQRQSDSVLAPGTGTEDEGLGFGRVVAVTVPVMKVRTMRMLVSHRLMPVPMRMWLGDRPIVIMLMMVVVTVGMVMFQQVVRVLMVMPFGQMQPKADRHQHPRDDE